jgi:hypothetical protein
MEHPPKGSKMQGGFRELVYGEQKTALDPAEIREVLGIERILLARVTQSRQMEQQSIIKEMRQDQHLTREDHDDGGSLRSKLFG